MKRTSYQAKVRIQAFIDRIKRIEADNYTLPRLKTADLNKHRSESRHIYKLMEIASENYPMKVSEAKSYLPTRYALRCDLTNNYLKDAVFHGYHGSYTVERIEVMTIESAKRYSEDMAKSLQRSLNSYGKKYTMVQL